MKVGFIGLGIMGAPMARCLVEKGFVVTAWDKVPQAGQDLPGRVAELCQAVQAADAIVTMLPAGDDVTAVAEEILTIDTARPRLFVDCSTIEVAQARDLAGRLIDAGWGFVDAPVSGGAEAAETGNLSFMVGGRTADVAAAQPLLDAMGRQTTAFGDAGAGQAAKACHNMICGITALGVCEGFALADSLGLDLDSFFQLCKNAAAQSWVLENRCPVPGPAPATPASNDYAPGFAARLMAKDLRVAQAAAEASGQETAFGAEAARRFSAFAEGESGDLDFSAIYRTIRRS